MTELCDSQIAIPAMDLLLLRLKQVHGDPRTDIPKELVQVLDRPGRISKLIGWMTPNPNSKSETLGWKSAVTKRTKRVKITLAKHA